MAAIFAPEDLDEDEEDEEFSAGAGEGEREGGVLGREQSASTPLLCVRGREIQGKVVV